jgi:glycerol-3-phosphate acyltransferase PlsX
MDPRRANGGVFLGLNGIVIKSHGGTDAEGFAAAIELGHGVVQDELLARIRTALALHVRSQPRPMSQMLGGAAS